MDYHQRIVKAADYIEEHLCEKISIAEVASIVCVSMFHFCRMFQAITGETPGDYIRKRRLTKASQLLLNTNQPVMDIAYALGFESHESFIRSFHKTYACSPGNYRKRKLKSVLFERKQITINQLKHLTGGLTMKPEIKTLEAFQVVGMKTLTSLKNNKLPQLWIQFLQRVPEIKHRIIPEISVGLCMNDSNFDISTFTDDTEYESMTAVIVDSDRDIPNGMLSKQISGGKYAVFTHIGSLQTLSETYDFIWGKWLPNSEFEVDSRDDFEWYDQQFLGPEHPESKMFIYIPVK